MLGRKRRDFKPHLTTLESLVPQNHFYRQLEAKLDLSFVYELVTDSYCWWTGRPSIDPVVFFKLQLIMLFDDIRSERLLMETVAVNLAHRWYIGYDFDEKLPDHSSLTRIRDRYGLEIFQRFFEKIVEKCFEAGLVWGEELYFDGTRTEANASKDRYVPDFYFQAKQHLDSRFKTKPEAENLTEPAADATESKSRAWMVEKYDGHERILSRSNRYKRWTDTFINMTDPDAIITSRGPATSQMSYHTHYVVDGGKARIILAVLVSSASISDNLPMLDMLYWSRFRWGLKPRIGVGDSKYATFLNVYGLESQGIRAYFPVTDYSQRKDYFPPEAFTYRPETDTLICPNQQTLKREGKMRDDGSLVYHIRNTVCRLCPLKSQCVPGKRGRYIYRHIYWDEMQRVKSYRGSPEYKKALKKRQVWVEPLFGEGKQWHQMRRFRLRGIKKVNIEALFRASVQNIKRLLKGKPKSFRPQPPAQTGALKLLPVFSTCGSNVTLAH